jgi:hypothetical protein
VVIIGHSSDDALESEWSLLATHLTALWKSEWSLLATHLTALWKSEWSLLATHLGSAPRARTRRLHLAPLPQGVVFVQPRG